jgi:hypothetical protein
MSSHIHDAYLGNGVHASFDGYQIWLRTERDGAPQIALEEETFQALVRYRERLIAEIREGIDDGDATRGARRKK